VVLPEPSHPVSIVIGTAATDNDNDDNDDDDTGVVCFTSVVGSDDEVGFDVELITLVVVDVAIVVNGVDNGTNDGISSSY
jgi:hypothetical protein